VLLKTVQSELGLVVNVDFERLWGRRSRAEEVEMEKKRISNHFARG